jgi:hypothetical protein
MAKSGIERIDKLFEGAADSKPIKNDDTDVIAIAVVQDLLLGHLTEKKFRALPDIGSPNYGKLNTLTKAALAQFRKQIGQPKSNDVLVDSTTLISLVKTPAPNPVASLAYMTLRLGVTRSGTLVILPFVAFFEARRRFAGLNFNTDRQGLSLGLIQWAQSRGRLYEILNAFKTQQPKIFANTFGGPTDAAEMLAQAKLGAAGLYSKKEVEQMPNAWVGKCKSVLYDLAESFEWQQRFRNAAQEIAFQKIQTTEAEKNFKQIVNKIRNYATVIESERGFAFMIDLSNQHGPNVGKKKTGAKALYQKFFTAGIKESELLSKIQDESVKILARQYGKKSGEAKSTFSRRQFFRTSLFFSDEKFVD